MNVHLVKQGITGDNTCIGAFASHPNKYKIVPFKVAQCRFNKHEYLTYRCIDSPLNSV